MAAKNEARVKFTAETTEFNQNIKESETKMAALRSELKLNSEQMKTSGVSIEGLEAKHEMLKQVLAESENKTKNLSDKLEAAKRIYGENSEEVLRLQSKLNNAAASQSTRYIISFYSYNCQVPSDLYKTFVFLHNESKTKKHIKSTKILPVHPHIRTHNPLPRLHHHSHKFQEDFCVRFQHSGNIPYRFRQE